MKILHWDEAFHPSFGYQINSLAKYQSLAGFDVTIVSSDRINQFPVFKNFQIENQDIDALDNEYSEKYNVKIIRWPWRLSKLAKTRIVHKHGFLKFLKNSDADIIMVHTNDTISSIKIARHYKYIGKPLIFDNHMLDMASKNPLRKLFRLYFRIFITPKIKKNKWIVIRTQDDDYVIKHFKIPKEQAPFISFGSDTTLFHPNNDIKKEFRAANDISKEDPVFIYAGKLTEEKGGLILAEAFKEKFNGKKANLIVVGNTSGLYGQKVDDIFAASENNILRFKTQKFTDLPKFYQSSDFSIFPKECSLSFYDVQACGLPTILEDNNVNCDRVSFNNGFLYKTNSLESLREKISLCISSYLSADYYQKANNCVDFINSFYKYDLICQKYNNILISEFERQKCLIKSK